MHLKKDFNLFITMHILMCFTVALPTQMGWHECIDRKAKDSKCCILKNKSIMEYNPNSQICCNGTLKRYETGLNCCINSDTDTSEFYSEQISDCCLGRIYDKGNDPCCDGKRFNQTTQLCCSDTSKLKVVYIIYEIEKVGPTCPPYHYEDKRPQSEDCRDMLKDSIKEFYGCCEGKFYNKEKKVCCNGRIEDKSKNIDSCCGTQFIGNHQRCCRDKPYNRTMYMCLNNEKIVPISTPICGNEEYDSNKVCCGTYTMVKRKKDDNECCKALGHKPGVTINNKYEKCKDGIVYSTVKCNVTHSPESFTCCDGFVYDQPAKNSVCCNGRAEWITRNLQKENCRPSLCNGSFYDVKDYECCNNELIRPWKYACINNKPYRYYNRHDSFYSNFKICGIYAISNGYNCCAESMPYRNNKKYNCPLGDFGYEKPIKPRDYPFWPVIKCRSQKKMGTIVGVQEQPGGLILIFKEKGRHKEFTIKVSNMQLKKIKALKGKRVTVYFDKRIKDEMFFGEHSAIEPNRRRKRKKFNPKICDIISNYFESGTI